MQDDILLLTRCLQGLALRNGCRSTGSRYDLISIDMIIEH